MQALGQDLGSPVNDKDGGPSAGSNDYGEKTDAAISGLGCSGDEAVAQVPGIWEIFPEISSQLVQSLIFCLVFTGKVSFPLYSLT